MSISTELTISGIPVEVVRKGIKNLHLGVYPPSGHVRVSAPLSTPDEAVRAAVVTRLPWVKRQRARYLAAKRQPVRRVVTGETHLYRGRAYRLRFVEQPGKGGVFLKGGSSMLVHARAGTSEEGRRKILDDWYRERLKEAVTPLLAIWCERLELEGVSFRLRRMRTRWATVNENTRVITLNPEIMKQSPDALEYLLVHELVHLFEHNHTERFAFLLGQQLPDWTQRRNRLNASLLGYEDWKY